MFESVFISSSMPSFLVIDDPISDPTADPINPPTTVAMSDSRSESVEFFPIAPPMAAPVAAPISLSPSIVTFVTSLMTPKTTYCCFWASDLETTSGCKDVFTHADANIILVIIIKKFYPCVKS